MGKKGGGFLNTIAPVRGLIDQATGGGVSNIEAGARARGRHFLNSGVGSITTAGIVHQGVETPNQKRRLGGQEINRQKAAAEGQMNDMRNQKDAVRSERSNAAKRKAQRLMRAYASVARGNGAAGGTLLGGSAGSGGAQAPKTLLGT